MKLRVRHLGLCDYSETLAQMQSFTEARGPATPDELWLLEHPPIFTLGQAGRSEHVIAAGDIPVVNSDRGGQVTYHGPGQLVLYALLDLRRLRLGVRSLVAGLERSVIDVLLPRGIEAQTKKGAPGVYVRDRKLAALGLRVRKGCCYHGLAINVRMDLSPFGRIEPCGYKGLEVTQLADLGIKWSLDETGDRVARALAESLHCAVEVVDDAGADSPASALRMHSTG